LSILSKDRPLLERGIGSELAELMAGKEVKEKR
jgi:hypothetical protein